MKEIHTPSSTRSRPALTRDPALDTRTPRARRSVHPTLGHHTTLHSDTTSGYSLCSTVAPRTLHTWTHTALHSDSTLEYTRASDSCAYPVRAHTSLLHGPCSGLVFTEGRTRFYSWSELRILAFLLLLLLFFFFLTNYYSHPEV